MDSQKISMGKIRRAYALNDHDAEVLMTALWPHGLFPWELWQKIYEKFWGGFADRNEILYHIESPAFPTNNTTEEKYFFQHIYAYDATKLFSRLAVNIHVNAIRLGLKELLEITYENSADVKVQAEIDSLLEKLTNIEKNSPYQFPAIEPDGFVSLMEDKMFGITPTAYDFISRLFSDTILVDKVAAILYLDSINFPLAQEVKGITRSLVDSVIKAVAQETPQVPATAQALEESAAAIQPQGQNTSSIPLSLWKGKSKEFIYATLKEKGWANLDIAYVLFHRRGFTQKRAIGKLLHDNPNLTDSAYDKYGKQLFDDSKHISIIDVDDL